MREVRFSRIFSKNLKKLPKSQQQKLIACLDLIKVDPYHPNLHTKPLSGRLSEYSSFRLSRDYRALFQVFPSHIDLVNVGHRKDIYRLIPS